jgi:RNA polymerase sigma factor (sigma-70 family)
MAAPTALLRGGGIGVEQAADGAWQPPSWDAIVREHSLRVFRLAYRLTGNRHEAEDLTQEVFVRVFRSLDSFRPGTFEGWLHRITTNLFLDQARRRRRIRFESLAENSDDRLAGSMPDPDLSFADQIFDDDIEVALRELKPEFRVAVVLCDVEGLSYEEISDVLGVKIGTVRSRIHRGRSLLRTALQHRAPTATRSRYRGAPDRSPAGGRS